MCRSKRRSYGGCYSNYGASASVGVAGGCSGRCGGTCGGTCGGNGRFGGSGGCGGGWVKGYGGGCGGRYGGCGQHRKSLITLAASAAYPHLRSLIDKAGSRQPANVQQLPASRDPQSAETGVVENGTAAVDEKQRLAGLEQHSGELPPSYERAIGSNGLVDDNGSNTADGMLTPATSVARSRAPSIASTAATTAGMAAAENSTNDAAIGSYPGPTAVVRVHITGRRVARRLRDLDAADDGNVALVRIPLAPDTPQDAFEAVLAAEVAAHVRMLAARGAVSRRTTRAAAALEAMSLADVRIRWRDGQDGSDGRGGDEKKGARDSDSSSTSFILDSASREKALALMAQRGWCDVLEVRLE